MSEAKDKSDAVEVRRLLAGAAKAIGSVRYCWLVTAAEDGFANLRPMGRLRLDADDGKDEWTIRLITDGRSRKSADIRRADKVAIVFHHDPDDAFVTLIGKATLYEGESEVRERWKDAYDAFLPDHVSESERANAIFVDVDVERMELWIRGVTPEPFGRVTILERNAEGDWRAVFR